MSDVKYPDIEVELSGEDGNAFAIIGRVSRAIRRDVGAEEAKQFTEAAMECESYDALLQHVMKTVNCS